MIVHNPIRLLWRFLVSAVMLAPAAGAFAADPPNPGASRASAATDGSASGTAGVDFFAAIRDGDLDVKFIPRDSRRAQVVIKNTTDQPLTVKLPEAFAALPVLAQQAGLGGAGAGNRNTGTGNNKNQGVGGGLGNAGGGGGAGFGGATNIQPDKVVRIQVDVVCLDYGKPEPSPHVPYTIVPIEQYEKDPEVQEVCRMLGEGKLDQRAAQIAAWHLANHMTWDELANLKVFPHFPQYTRPYFSADEISEGMKIVDQAIKLADARKAANTATSASAVPATASPGNN